MNQANSGHEALRSTTVLVVGGPSALIDCTTRASRSVPVAEVVSCELRDAPTNVAELWPFAIVMSEDLYGFDAAECVWAHFHHGPGGPCHIYPSNPPF